MQFDDFIVNVCLDRNTGLTDKDGHTVFENDDVEYTLKRDEHGDLETQRGKIIFENAAFCIENEGPLYELLTMPSFSIKVIVSHTTD